MNILSTQIFTYTLILHGNDILQLLNRVNRLCNDGSWAVLKEKSVSGDLLSLSLKLFQMT